MLVHGDPVPVCLDGACREYPDGVVLELAQVLVLELELEPELERVLERVLAPELVSVLGMEQELVLVLMNDVRRQMSDQSRSDASFHFHRHLGMLGMELALELELE